MRLPSRLRLKESRDFAVIKAQGRSQSGRYFVLALLRDEGLADFRFGLITGKRLGNAVVRNRLRRQMREIIRANRAALVRRLSLDLTGLPPADASDSSDLSGLVDELLKWFGMFRIT